MSHDSGLLFLATLYIFVDVIVFVIFSGEINDNIKQIITRKALLKGASVHFRNFNMF